MKSLKAINLADKPIKKPCILDRKLLLLATYLWVKQTEKWIINFAIMKDK